MTTTPSVIINGIQLNSGQVKALHAAVYALTRLAATDPDNKDTEVRRHLSEVFTLLRFTQDIEILGDTE